MGNRKEAINRKADKGEEEEVKKETETFEMAA